MLTMQVRKSKMLSSSGGIQSINTDYDCVYIYLYPDFFANKWLIFPLELNAFMQLDNSIPPGNPNYCELIFIHFN